MSEIVWLLYLLALAMGVGAGMALLRSRKADIYLSVRRRFNELSVPVQLEGEGKVGGWRLAGLLSDNLLRAGIEPSARLYWLAGSALGLIMAFGYYEAGIPGALLFGWVAVILAGIYLRVRYKRRMAAMQQQLPGFIDFLVRGVSVGQTLGLAVRHATENTQQPLREVLDRVAFNADLGGDLGEAFRNAGTLHRLRELDLLALAISVNQRYGGSVRDLLRSIIQMLEQRDRAQRELRSMTGETRLSAWVLGLMPTGIALYMIWMNPGYMATMWNDPGGRMMLYTGVSGQLLGGFILWRMLKSI